jgi:hypothetical protein
MTFGTEVDLVLVRGHPVVARTWLTYRGEERHTLGSALVDPGEDRVRNPVLDLLEGLAE